jgi:hypothetical protein
MFLRNDLDFSGIAPGPMHSCDLCFLRLKYDCLVKQNQALRGRNLTRDSLADGAPMTHQASGAGNCQGPFLLPAIGHPTDLTSDWSGEKCRNLFFELWLCRDDQQMSPAYFPGSATPSAVRISF